MRVSVFSQRSVNDASVVTSSFKEIVGENGYITFVHGGAKGAQEIILDWFEGDVITYRPWTAISKALSRQAYKEGAFDPVYFFFRNIQIVENSDLVIIFDNGEKDAEVYKVKNLCEKKGIKYEVVEL